MSKFFLCIIFITKDRKSHLFETHFIPLVDLSSASVCIFIIYIFIFLFYSVHMVDDLRYTRDYDIRKFNDISHCDYFRLQE